MPVVRKSSAAEDDLLEMYLYVGRKQSNPIAAERLLLAIDKKCREYASQPWMETARPELGSGIRTFPCGTKTNPREWIAVYRPIDDGIELLRVFRGKQDYPNLYG